MRTFLALEVPRPDREKILRIIEKFRDRRRPVKFVEFENLHITVKFLGEIDDAQKTEIAVRLKEFCGVFPPFQACLSGLGCFPGPRNPRILWVGVSLGEDQMRRLFRDLEKMLAQLGIREEDKPFHPHLTIGRIKSNCQVDDILAQEFAGEVFTVDSLTFFRSQLRPAGPVYEALDKFPLG